MGGPLSKYAALFDFRPAFDSLRVSFLHAADGKRLERLGEALGQDLESVSAPDENGIAAVVEYMEQCGAHFDASTVVHGSPPGFEEEAWPILVDCMCDEGRQFS